MKKVRRIISPIPKMTHPLSKALNQPGSNDMEFYQEVSGDDLFVKINSRDQDKISKRDWGLPTGVYEGKMWICKDKWLCWFDTSLTNKESCRTVTAKII